jgi:hypothetical protein
MDLDPRFGRGFVARRFSWLILVAGGWVLSALACSPSNDSVVVGNGGAGGSVDASQEATSTGGSVATGGNAGAPRGGGGAAGTGGTAGTGGAGGGTGGVADAASDVIIYVCPDGGNPNQDTDGDGVPDCVDGCPLDTLKRDPGICGCNMSDTADTDGDGRIDCQDNCPMDPMKFDPGVCGCGVSDTLDTDGDGTVDCLDGCPRDRNRTVAGLCGCVTIEGGDGLCLAHRYSFNDAPGTAVAADTGHGPAANGTVIGTTVMRGDAGNGFVTLAGVTSDQYVALPANIISTLGDNATFEAWVTWNPVNTSAWQRVFDFGSSTNGTQQGNGVTYLFLTPRAGPGALRTAFTLNGGGGAEDLVDNVVAAPAMVQTQLAVVVNGAAHSLKLYVNGGEVGAPGATMRDGYTLSHLNDINNWIGRSQWAADEEFAGTMHEFRIYSRALPPEQLLANAAAGPEVVPAPVFDAGVPDNPDGAAASDARADAPDAAAASDARADAPADAAAQ